MTLRIEYYQDKRNEWRWTLVAANHKALADSGEGYKNQADMMHALSLIRGSTPIPLVPSAAQRQRMAMVAALANAPRRTTIAGAGFRNG
jgi:uncharacterized protein YegP (UPF0339 family)